MPRSCANGEDQRAISKGEAERASYVHCPSGRNARKKERQDGSLNENEELIPHSEVGFGQVDDRPLALLSKSRYGDKLGRGNAKVLTFVTPIINEGIIRPFQTLLCEP